MAGIAPPSGSRGGYEYNFVKPPLDTLLCTICFLPSKEPYLTACCGHTFCKSCLEGSKKYSNICPMCRSEEFDAIFNKQADRMIRSLYIFCANKEQGCEWQGEVYDINDHLGNCLFQVIHCSNECGECLQRQHLTSHVETECPRRTVSCQYCDDVGEYQFIEDQHKEKCSKFPVQCPNECEIETIHRDEVEEHREVCPLEMIQCDYHVVGCKVKMARKDMNTHKQKMMEVHLSLSISELMETKMQLKATQNSLKHEVEKTKDDLTQQLVWHTAKIAYTEQQLSTNQQEANVIREDLTEQLLCMEKDLTGKLRASQLETKKTNQDLTQQIVHIEKVTAKLTASQQEATRTKDQLLQKLNTTAKELNTTKQQLATTCKNLAKAEKEHTTLAASTDKALTEMENKFQAKITEVVTASEKKIAELQAALQQRTQLIEQVFSPWLMSLHNQASKLSSGNQVVPVIVKVTKFTKIVEGHGWLSKPFYDTRNKDCKLQLKVVANKIDEVTYDMSVLLLGDSKVHNKHTTSKEAAEQPARTNHELRFLFPLFQSSHTRDESFVKLLNQISDNEHIKVYLKRMKHMPLATHSAPLYKPPIDSNTLYYNLHFASYKELQRNTTTCQYLRDDALFFEVCVVLP